MVLKSGSLNLLEPSGPVEACNEIALLLQGKAPDDGQRNCPKHVEFHSKINLRN
jgi:hypothetical protein